jgi:hypothetical protein
MTSTYNTPAEQGNRAGRKENAKPTIKMICRNPITRKLEEVYPEDEFSINRAFPVFLTSDGKYCSVPGCEAVDVWDKWISQHS